MIDVITINEQIDYEFDLEEIGLYNHFLFIDTDEGTFIKFNDCIYYIDYEFLKSDSLSLPDEDGVSPPMIISPEQKELIKEIFDKIINPN